MCVSAWLNAAHRLVDQLSVFCLTAARLVHQDALLQERPLQDFVASPVSFCLGSCVLAHLTGPGACALPC